MDRDEMQTQLDQDSGDAPGSPYGTKASVWGPVAIAAATILQGEQGEALTLEAFEQVIGLVVNGHPDPGYLIANYGPLYEINPADYLDADEILDYTEATI